MIQSSVKSLPETALYTDASLTAGAAYYNKDFLYACWEIDFPDISDQCIYVKELCSVVLGFRRWAHLWSHRHIHVYTDNKATEWAIRRGLTRNKTANSLLKELLWTAARFNITVVPHYIESRANQIADALSRMDSFMFLVFVIKYFWSVGIDVTHPMFNWCNHMSYSSKCFLFPP